jgi:hypothetical protein
MPALSAADAISPAIQRTKSFLFRPFELWTYLKLCLVAVLTEGIGGNFNSSIPGGGGSHGSTHSNPHPVHPVHPGHLPISPLAVASVIASLLLVIVIAAFVYYLITRLRFAFFHCLILQTKEIKPGWHLYRNQAGRFFKLNFVIGLLFLLMAAVMVLPFAIGIFRMIRLSGGHPNIAGVLLYILPLLPIVLLIVLIGVAMQVILVDFIMPHMALENASAGEAWAAVRARIAAEKGGFLLYAVLRFVLPLVGLMAFFMILLIPGLVMFGCGTLVIAGLHSAFAQATGAAAIAGLILQGLVVAIGLSFMMLVGLMVGGPISVWVRTYALTFYGARYQPLGELMAPAVPPGFQPFAS